MVKNIEKAAEKAKLALENKKKLSSSKKVDLNRRGINSNLFGVIAVLLIAGVIFGVIILNAKRKADQKLTIEKLNRIDTVTKLSQLDKDSTFILGKIKAKKTIDIYQDFMCPSCALFERRQGDKIAQGIKAGVIRARYHVLNFLDAASASKNYSTRAGVIMQCVARTIGGEDYKLQATVVTDLQKRLYSEKLQPTENGTTDLSNSQLLEQAKLAGANKTKVANCINDKRQHELFLSKSKSASDNLQNVFKEVGTPTILVNGKKITDPFTSDSWLK